MAVVEGRLQIRDWQDNNGNKRRSAEIVADNVYFGDSKRDGDGGGYPAVTARPLAAILLPIMAAAFHPWMRTMESFRSDV